MSQMLDMPTLAPSRAGGGARRAAGRAKTTKTAPPAPATAPAPAAKATPRPNPAGTDTMHKKGKKVILGQLDQTQCLLADFGRRLTSARKRVFITRTALANATELHNDTLRTYEMGRNFPHALAMRKLILALGVTSDYLLFGNTAGMAIERVRALHPGIEARGD